MIGRSLIILAVTTLGATAVIAQSSKITVHRGPPRSDLRPGDSPSANQGEIGAQRLLPSQAGGRGRMCFQQPAYHGATRGSVPKPRRTMQRAIIA